MGIAVAIDLYEQPVEFVNVDERTTEIPALPRGLEHAIEQALTVDNVVCTNCGAGCGFVLDGDRDERMYWQPVLVVVDLAADGSVDGKTTWLCELCQRHDLHEPDEEAKR